MMESDSSVEVSLAYNNCSSRGQTLFFLWTALRAKNGLVESPLKSCVGSYQDSGR